MEGNEYKCCLKCETDKFCQDVNRCMKQMMYEGFSDGEINDINDPLTADDVQGLKKIIGEKNIFKKPLRADELDIIKAAIN